MRIKKFRRLVGYFNMPQVSAGFCSDGDRAAFLQAMRVVPGAVAIIACRDGLDVTGMAATAWNSLTADPPTVLACVNLTASAHALIQNAKAFSVNLVPTEASEIVAIFSGQRGLSGSSRFDNEEWSVGPAGQPMLNSAVISLECELVADHGHETHTIFIGRVGAIRRQTNASALMYANGVYGRMIDLD